MILSKGDSLQDGKYIIEENLGEGGFGVTYKAKNTFLNLTVVIKTLKEEKIKHPNNQNYLARFNREARVLADLSQQRNLNIVQVKDFFEESGIPYLVMEFLSGESLGMRVKRLGVLSESLALQYISQIGSALKGVHNAGLVHRDAHPDNIMIMNDQAILIDFGIVGRIDPPYLTTDHPTHYYFAPYEQKDGSLDPKVDIYALAASLYYALTTKYPTPSFDRKYKSQSLTPPRQWNPSISREAEATILKGIQLEPEDRPQSMQEWLKLLTNTSSRNNDFISIAPTTNFLERIIQFFTKKSPTPPSTSQPENVQPPQTDDDLSSDRSIDYTRLRDLLRAKNWKNADYETYLVMLKVMGLEKGDYITNEELLNFPCTDLRTIDRLWVKYSNERFGFSVQKNIYLEVGGIPDGKYLKKAWDSFGDRVGWRMNGSWIYYGNVTFDTIAPVGHLPCRWWDTSGGDTSGLEVRDHLVWVAGYARLALASRLVNCNI